MAPACGRAAENDGLVLVQVVRRLKSLSLRVNAKAWTALDLRRAEDGAQG
jgi:hypothetical protein